MAGQRMPLNRSLLKRAGPTRKCPGPSTIVAQRCDMKFTRYYQVSRLALLVVLALVVAVPASTQTAQSNSTSGDNASVNASLVELQSQVRELKEMVLQLQQQTTASRAEISRMRQELEAQHSASSTVTGAESALDEPSPATSSSSADS